jgi:hypothetical protein
LSDNVILKGLTPSLAKEHGFIPLEQNGRAVTLWLDPHADKPVLVESRGCFKPLLPLVKEGNVFVYPFVDDVGFVKKGFDTWRFLDTDGLVVGFSCHKCQYFFDGGDRGVSVSVKEPIFNDNKQSVFLWDRKKEAVLCQACFNKAFNCGSVRPGDIQGGIETVVR